MTQAATRGLTAAVVAAIVALSALPAVTLEAPGDYAGDWTLSGVSEGAEVCDAILTTDEAIGGWSVQLAADCQDRFTLPEDIAAWTVIAGGAIGFIDPLRRVLLKFEPTEIGGYVAYPATGEPIALDRAGETPTLTEQQRMSGDWTLTALGGAPTCRLRLTAGADGMGGALRKLGTCRPPWAKSDLASWTRKGDRITLLNRKGKAIVSLGGDSIQGFSGETQGIFVGFIRQGGDD